MRTRNEAAIYEHLAEFRRQFLEGVIAQAERILSEGGRPKGVWRRLRVRWRSLWTSSSAPWSGAAAEPRDEARALQDLGPRFSSDQQSGRTRAASQFGKWFGALVLRSDIKDEWEWPYEPAGMPNLNYSEATEMETLPWLAAEAATVAAEALRCRTAARMRKLDAWSLRAAHALTRGYQSADLVRRSKGGQARSRTRPASTKQRNKKMREKFQVMVLHDGMNSAEAIVHLSTDYRLTPPQVRRIVEPRKLNRNLRHS